MIDLTKTLIDKESGEEFGIFSLEHPANNFVAMYILYDKKGNLTRVDSVDLRDKYKVKLK